MLIRYPITLNCKKTNIQKRIKANTGEGNERELIITLTDGDKKLNLYNRGLVAAVVGVKPDGTKFSNSAVIAEDSTIRYTLTTQNVVTEGTVDCQVRILDSVDTGVLFSAKFSIEVEANLSNEEAEESSNEWTELIAALDQVYKQVTVYQGSGAPTGTDFENIKVSDFYYDTLNKDYYYCSEIRRSGGGLVIIDILWKKLLNSIPEEYVKFSDYPTYQKAGVVKKGSGFEVDENGAAIGVEYGPETVPILSGRTFMSKKTVLNLIDYLELVNETQLQEGLDEKQDIITAGNGIDITGTTISAKVRDLSDNALTNNQNGLYVSKYTLGFDTNLRQNLADTAASNALASKAYVDELMSGAVKRQVVQTLPVSDIDENTIYMVPKTTEETDNIYDEYMYINDEWELIGTTEVDLSNYYTKTQVDNIAAGKQDTIDSTHKLNADLVDDSTSTNKFVTASDKSTWSGKQDTLTAGNGIKIENNEISIDTSNFWEVIIPKVSPYEDYIMSKSGNLWINNPSWYKHCTYDIPDGVKEIKFSGKGENASYPAIIYFDANNAVIDFYGTTSSQLNNETQTIPTGTKKIVINGVNNSIFALAYKKEVDIAKIIQSNLYHKKISINGDSIAYGNAYTGGALKIIADNYKMTLDNVAVNGGTLTSGDNPNVHKICDTLDTMANDADYYIIMGGYNDYNYNTNLLGSITQTMTDAIDKNTVYGALELICRTLLTAHPTKKIGFIIEHKILTSAYTNKKFTMQQLHNAIVEVCEKYSISYCDLFELSQFNTEIDLFKQYTKGLDGIHPTYDGYNLFYCKHIKDWLETL